MIAALVLPALAVLLVGLVVTPPHRRLHPSLGTRALAVAAAAGALGAIAAVATLAVGWAAQHVGWCTTLTRTHDDIPAAVGLSALALLAAMMSALVRAGVRAHRSVPAARSVGELVVVEADRPEAYAVPGRPGQIVVTAGMLRLLDPAEREVLLAHERSHLRHRHHRYLAVAAWTAAVVPVLRFMTRRLRLAIERWADEDAAEAVGDRELVARTVIRAALATKDFEVGSVLALGNVGVRARVDALLGPAPERPFGPRSLAAGAAVALFGILAGSAVQIHHLVAFAAHVCGI